MIDTILEKLNKIEEEHDVKIIYGCESGSRGWGFPSIDSDYDVRFVYLRTKNSYLTIDEKPDFIEYPVDDILDINGWDIKKVLLHIKKSNGSILEWFSSPIVYMEKGNFKSIVNEAIPEYFMKAHTMYHYFHLGFKKFNESLSEDKIKIKTLFYILRPIFCLIWIEKNNSMPPMEFIKLVNDSNISSEIKSILDELILAKARVNESFKIDKNRVLWNFINEKINYYETYLENIGKYSITSYDRLNEIFINILNEEYNGI